MTERISKVQRWLDLVSFLVGRRFPVDVDEVMENVPAYAERWREGSDTERDSVRRMFERDKDELRGLGVPLESVEYSINYGMEQVEGYRLAEKDFYLPYLRLLDRAGEEGDDPDPDGESAAGERPPLASEAGTFEIRDDEASLALDALDHVLERDAFPLRDDARAARRKLTFDLDPEDLDRTPVLWIDPPGAGKRAALLDDLSSALLHRKRVRFTYHGITRDQRTERDVEPWGLLFQHSHWYLVGRDRDRDARRTFRVARMDELEVNGKRPATPDYATPDDLDLEELRSREAWELGEDDPVTARVRFTFPRSLWAERNGLGERVAERDVAGDGAQVRAFEVVQPDPFLRWVLSLAGDAEIVAPPELREAFRAMAARVRAVYRAGPGKGGRSSGKPGAEPGEEAHGEPGADG